MSGCRGFTLMELVVVLALLAMVAMLVVPRLPSTDNDDLKSSARALAATLRYMQDRAATARTTYYLHVEPGTDAARIAELGGDGNEKEPEDPLLRKQPIEKGIQVADVVIPRLGRVAEGQFRLDIGPGGLRDFVSIHLRAGNDNFWTVMAFPAGGKVKVYEGYREEPL
jgi:general secretion pathway protein H